MSQKITFYPEGNAECVLLEMGNGKRMLMDFADMHTGDARYTNLTDSFAGIKSFDVVMFSHAHEDHVKGAADFFYFDHALKYQTGNRAKIKELWVSSAFILDSNVCEDARVIRQEARYRLKNGYGIKVFSRPDALDGWLSDNGLSTADSEHPIIHAGTLIDSSMHSLGDEVSFFVHAPFSEDAEDVEDRNDPSIVLQVRLQNLYRNTNIFITGDAPHDIIDKIVGRSEANCNEGYLEWDLYDIPHHCSHTGLSDERGDTITETSDNIKRLLGVYSQQNGFLVASCRAFSDVGADDTQPPHIQAKKAYIKYSKNADGTEKMFFVTSEYRGITNPKPLRFGIDLTGITEVREKNIPITSSPAPRAG